MIFSVRAPIRKLPLEILINIFELACSSHVGLNSLSRNRRGVVPVATLVLSHICSRWRNLVVSVPALWSCFEFDYTQLGHLDSESLIHLFLERSRSHILDFALHVSDQSSLNCHKSDFFSIQNCARWRSVVIDGPALSLNSSENQHSMRGFSTNPRCSSRRTQSALLDTVLPLLFASQRTFPELRDLQVSSIESSPLSTMRFLGFSPSFSVTCPKLRSLVLHNLDTIDFRFTQPCPAVEYVALRGISATCASQILMSSLNVRDIILNVTRVGRACEWKPHTFHCARMLEIQTLDKGMWPMLDSFTMPALTHLRFISPMHMELPSALATSLVSLLTRSRAFLTHLTLHSICFRTSREILQLLHLLPTLTYLDYKPDIKQGEWCLKPLLRCLTPPLLRTEFDCANEAFAEVVQDGGDEQCSLELLLPNLQELVLTFWLETHPLLVNFLRLRKSSGGLQKLQVHLWIRRHYRQWNQEHSFATSLSASAKFQGFKGDDGLDVFVHNV